MQEYSSIQCKAFPFLESKRLSPRLPLSWQSIASKVIESFRSTHRCQYQLIPTCAICAHLKAFEVRQKGIWPSTELQVAPFIIDRFLS